MKQVLLLGFDSEWQGLGTRNTILSYQFFARVIGGGEWRGIIRPGGRRLRLSRFLRSVILAGFEAGHLHEWPDAIYLVGHFTLADLAAFADFKTLKVRFDSVRRTFLTIGRPLRLTIWDEQRHAHKVEVTLRDSMLLAPGAQQTLAALGHLVGLEKIELEPGEIENMQDLLLNDPERFDDYALRDPEVCVRYAERMFALNSQINGEASVPSTLSSIGVSSLLRTWETDRVNQHEVLGTELVHKKIWDKRRHTIRRRTETVLTRDRHRYESLVTESYHGGLNAQFFFGAGERGLWTDFDLCGAYPTALAINGMPAWNEIRQTRDRDEFQPHVLGYAQVSFSFPPGTRFPCLPVRTEAGLISPLSGITDCCAPEIYLAGKMGATLEIINGIVLPADVHRPPFAPFITACTKRRKTYGKGSLEELLWKEISNGLYGKLAQGLKLKRCYDSRTDEHQVLPPSRITNPYFAATTTSLVRAVIGEILHRLPAHVIVCSVTTDGFLTTATEAEVLAATQGPLCQLFSRARQSICGNPTIVEAKHRIAQPLGWRTRGQATLEALPGEPIVLAKAGLKAPFKDKIQANDWIITQFVSRTPASRFSYPQLRSLIELCRRGGDLVSKVTDRRLNMDYDWKRRPVSPSMRDIRGVPHLYFDTAPWNTVEEFTDCRDRWDLFRRDRVLKSLEDLRDFEVARTAPPVKGIQRPRRDGDVKLTIRLFLRAYVRSTWGLDGTTMTYPDLAGWLSASGYKISREDVENAARPGVRLVEHVVQPTAAVQNFIATVRPLFPDFEAERLLVIQSAPEPASPNSNP